MMGTIYSVRSFDLLASAQQLERDANESLPAWIILGQTDRYANTMMTVRALRSAAAERNITNRREMLRNSGFVVLTPKRA